MEDDGTLELIEGTRDLARGRLRMLVMWEGHSVAMDLPPSGELRIGRSKLCDAVVDHPSVSRAHAAVDVDAGVARVRDLGSQNGTRVNGRRLEADERAELRPGVLVEIGRAVLVVQPRDTLTSVHEPPDEPLEAPPPGLVVPAAGPMRQVYRLVAHVAKSRLSVLLLGETGVGKEVVAEALHRWSDRSKGPFVRLNCAAVAESLLESELFGYEKGAFTGAAQAKPGLTETADGGTLFLDELGDMPLATQAKLLRVLESREVLRVGALKPRPVNLRVVAATHKDLEAAMKAGTFRADLFYRLNGVSIVIPPLRARDAEIADLAVAFARRACAESGRAPVRFSNEAMAALRAHLWPGNVRELRNVVERAAALCRGDVVEPSHLLEPALSPPEPGSSGTLADDMSALEKKRILDALERAGGNQSEVARELGIPRRTLVRRLREYGVTQGKKR